MAVAPSNGLRFVAVTRRGYPGSTPFSDSETSVATNGTVDEQTSFLIQRGVEFNMFIHNFSKKFGLPALSKDKTRGGFEVMGWSLGTFFALWTVSAWDALPRTSRIVSGLR